VGNHRREHDDGSKPDTDGFINQKASTKKRTRCELKDSRHHDKERWELLMYTSKVHRYHAKTTDNVPASIYICA
jgi:hypothetical protein